MGSPSGVRAELRPQTHFRVLLALKRRLVISTIPVIRPDRDCMGHVRLCRPWRRTLSSANSEVKKIIVFITVISAVQSIRLEYLNKSTRFINFLPCCMHCMQRGLAMRKLSVRPFVCPSNAWIVTKRKKNMSRFLYERSLSLYFSEKKNG